MELAAPQIPVFVFYLHSARTAARLLIYIFKVRSGLPVLSKRLMMCWKNDHEKFNAGISVQFLRLTSCRRANDWNQTNDLKTEQRHQRKKRQWRPKSCRL